jgi:hypothetical protein
MAESWGLKGHLSRAAEGLVAQGTSRLPLWSTILSPCDTPRREE